jgi:hypothetical protein
MVGMIAASNDPLNRWWVGAARAQWRVSLLPAHAAEDPVTSPGGCPVHAQPGKLPDRMMNEAMGPPR